MSSTTSSDDETPQIVEVKESKKPATRLTKSGQVDKRSQSSRNNIQKALQHKINLAKNKKNEANVILTDSESDDSSSDEEPVEAPKKTIKLKKDISQAVYQVKKEMKKATKNLANPPDIPKDTSSNDFKLLREEIDTLKKQLVDKAKADGKPVQKPSANDLAVIYRNIMRI